MTYTLWSQDFFAKGELSPLMYSRVTLNAYYQGLKVARNVLCFPQGAAGKRFGTKYVTNLASVTSAEQVYFKSFQYLNECVYLLVFRPLNIDIYLENFLVASLNTSPINTDELRLINSTILDNRFIVTTGIYAPYQLARTSGVAQAITAFSSVNGTLTTGTAGTVNGIYPARFSFTAGLGNGLPSTAPQIHVGKTYFIRYMTTTTYRIFTTAEDAAANLNYYTVNSAGVNAFMSPQNTWTFSAIPFQNVPVFDFDKNYDSLTFTPGATTVGTSTTLTASGAIFDSGYVNGVFDGNGGLARITAYVSPTQVTIFILTAFNSTAAIPGNLSFLARPAWSDTRGWPRKCSSFQNRFFLANTDLLPNGLWGSVINDYYDFNEFDPDNPETAAISWFPSSGTVNYINYIVPYRSLTIHTNSGVFSTPLSVENAITAANFSLALQDSTPADNVQPTGIDNQIIVLSGNDAHSLLWDGFNNAYSTNIISIVNEQLIREPVDEAAYVDRQRAGSRYMFIVNADGSVAIYQSLIAENVSGFTPAYLEQSWGQAYFRWVTSSLSGRAWFLTERELADAGTTIAITGFAGNPDNTLTAVGSNFPIQTSKPIVFTTAGSLPETSPQVKLSTVYWTKGVTLDTFKVYLNQEDALADENEIVIASAGTSSSITYYTLASQFFIEEVDFDAQMDCTGYYPNPLASGATSSITGQDIFNAQDILMQGDGFGFEDTVTGGAIEFTSHGSSQEIVTAQYGFPINVAITPMPLSVASGHPKSSNLVANYRMMIATFLFADTIGGTIQSGNNVQPITMKTLNQTIPGDAPTPQTGSMEVNVLRGWDNFNYNSFTIAHSEPFGIKLTGIFYKLDI